jgi:hypothetical protein
MRRKHFKVDIDHTDPKWEKGRDYQLICGLNNHFNFSERDPKFNTSKSNRFLPWRLSSNEIGCVPINQGDLCLFLDPDTNEWVLEEFLGKWWFEKSSRTAGYSQSDPPELIERRSKKHRDKGRKNTPESIERMRIAALSREPRSLESRRKQSESSRGHKKPKTFGSTVSNNNKNRVKTSCIHCQKTLNLCYLSKHLKTIHKDLE